MRWIQSIRPLMVFFSFLLTFAGFRMYFGFIGNAAILPAITTAFICASSMSWNNWRDRLHNRHLGRTLAADNPRLYFLFALTMWSGSMSLTLLLWHLNSPFTPTAMLMLMLGLVYSEARKLLVIQNCIVGICSACPILFMLTADVKNEIWLLFWGVVIIIVGREIIKDIFDVRHDIGWKNTLPIIMGVKQAKLISGVLLLSGPLFIASAINTPVVIACLCVEIFGLAAGFLAKSHVWAKPVIDIGMASFLIIVFFLS